MSEAAWTSCNDAAENTVTRLCTDPAQLNLFIFYRYYKKSKYRHRSNSSSDYSSRHKHSSRTNLREEYHSKKLHRRRNSSSSNESTSNGCSNVSSKFTQSKNSKTFNDSENALPNSSSYSQSDVSEVKSKDQSDSLFQQTVCEYLLLYWSEK